MATKIDLSAYKHVYNTTASEYLEKMIKSLLHLSQTPRDRDAVETIYLSAHSLKAQSILMGYTNTGALCEEIEHIFRELQEKQTIPSAKLLEILGNALQSMRNSLKSIEQNNKELSLTKTIEKLKTVEKTSV